MNKKTKQHDPFIDIDTFEDVSLYQLIPSGKGFGQTLLKTHIDAVMNGRARLNSLLITGKEGLLTHSTAFLRALGIENFNQIDGSHLQNAGGIHQFFCVEDYDGFVITGIERILNGTQRHLCKILKKKHFAPYNYLKESFDAYEIIQPIIMTSKNRERVDESILANIDHIVEIEKYTVENLRLVVMQRCMYAHIEPQDDSIIEDIVKYGNSKLYQIIRFLKCCIAVMQADGRQILTGQDVSRAMRLIRLS